MSQAIDAFLRAQSWAPAHKSPSYSRYLLGDSKMGLLAQLIEFTPSGLEMSVRAHPDVLDLDFRFESVRCDVPGAQRDRAGFRLHDELQRIDHDVDTVLFNGNNVGYWGNQFVIHDRELVWKRLGPLFADDSVAADLAGLRCLFGWGPAGFTIDHHKFIAYPTADGSVELHAVDQNQLPFEGLSGFPLLHAGARVWQDNISDAWDPRLLFDVGRLTGVTRTELKSEMRDWPVVVEELVRHPLTVVGVTERGEALVLVVEQSRRSRGLTVAEAADVMIELGAKDALVLGAAGDAQLATTEEGFLVAPLVADYARSSARKVPRQHRSPELGGMPVAARPVPCLVSITDLESTMRTKALHLGAGSGRHTYPSTSVSRV